MANVKKIAQVKMCDFFDNNSAQKNLRALVFGLANVKVNFEQRI